MGRPSEFTPDIANEICERLADGESLRSICLDENMPAKSTVMGWLARDEHPGFVDHYTRARELQADSLFDECQDIADDATNDWMERKGEEEEQPIGWQLNGEHVQRSRLRIDTRKWMAGKLRPKKYGDATMLKHADADGNNLDMAAMIAERRAKVAGNRE